MMKRTILLTLPLLLDLLLYTSVAGAQGRLSAFINGMVINGSYIPQENLAVAGIAVCSENDTTRFELFGVGEFKKITQDETTKFTLDLSTVQGLFRITSIKGGTSEYFSTLTQEQRNAIVVGKMSVRVYRGTEFSPDDLLAECDVEPASTAMMLSSAGIVNGVLDDEYGKKGTQKSKGIPTLSPPISILNLPEATKALAIAMIDPDGHDWVHWIAVNVPVAEEIPKNSSIDLAKQMEQGKNSFGTLGYGGPTPPSGTHTYVITVYALSEPLMLDNGFKLKAFRQALEGKVLAQAELTAEYSK